MLRKRSSVIASFLEYPVCSTLKMYVAFSKCIDSGCFIFILHYSLIVYVENLFIIVEVSGAPRRKHCYCFLRGAACM